MRGLWRGLWVGTPWAYSFHYCSPTCPSPVCPVQFSSPTKRLGKGKYKISVPDQDHMTYCMSVCCYGLTSKGTTYSWPDPDSYCCSSGLLLQDPSVAGKRKRTVMLKKLFILQVLLMMEATYRFRINRF